MTIPSCRILKVGAQLPMLKASYHEKICGSTPCEMVSHHPEAAGISQVHNDSGFLSGRRGSMTRFMDISTHSESSSSHNPLG